MTPDPTHIVMLHGWGLHSGLMEPLAARFRPAARVTCLDLPGHGGRPFEPPFSSLAELAAAVATDLPPACILVGWSLGGMVAARLAANRHPAVHRLVLLATTPRFVSGPDWPHGLPREVVDEFAAALGRDYRDVIRRFLALQARGDDLQGALLRQLRAAVFARGEPDTGALRAGLAVLIESDLREEVARIAVPTLVVSGQHDRLTPPGAGRWLSETIDGATFTCIPGAGHAPFLSHPDETAGRLTSFLAGPLEAGAVA